MLATASVRRHGSNRQHVTLTEHYGLETWRNIDLTWLRDMGGSSLTDLSLPVPDATEGYTGRCGETEAVPSTYVPFRNATLLAATWAEVLEASEVYCGAHAPPIPPIRAHNRPSSVPLARLRTEAPRTTPISRSARPCYTWTRPLSCTLACNCRLPCILLGHVTNTRTIGVNVVTAVMCAPRGLPPPACSIP